MNINDAFPSKYLKTADLKGRDVTVTIDAVEMITLPNDQGRKLALRFEGKDKQWIVNKTNANTIAKLLNSGVMEDWIGKQITIYPTETAYQGEMVDCIRVRRNKADTFSDPPRNIAPTEPPIEMHDDDVPF
jgi:hypothetical protein